jgi:FixJ family two-component response regulator
MLKKNNAVIHFIDDEPDVLEIYSQILDVRYKVESFEGSSVYLQKFKSAGYTAPDLMIIDFRMPGMTGLELIKLLFDHCHTIPVILLSAQLDKKVVMDAHDIGVLKMLDKPVSEAVLFASIEQLLLEGDIFKIRQQIRESTNEIRELFEIFRMACSPYIPPRVRSNLLLDSPERTKAGKSLDFDQVVNQIEQRLERLIATETLLEEVRVNKFRHE